jgi:hypothetical protein
MPFDCAPLIDEPKQAAATAVEALGTNIVAGSAGAIRPRPIVPWYMSRRAEGVDAAVAVLAHALELISDERHWCKRAFAFTWLDIPVPVGSRYARRFCALGAIIRAGRELGLPVENASTALARQTMRPVIEWNDDKLRTHAEVVAAFDAALDALAVMTPAA